MTGKRREALTATALLAAIAGATLAQVLDRPSPQPSSPVHAYLMPVQAPEAHLRGLHGLGDGPGSPRVRQSQR